MNSNFRIPLMVVFLACAFLWPFAFRYNESVAIIGAAVLALLVVVFQFVLAKRGAGRTRKYSFSLSDLFGVTAFVAVGMAGLPLLMYLAFQLASRESPLAWSLPLVLAGAIGGAALFLHWKLAQHAGERV